MGRRTRAMWIAVGFAWLGTAILGGREARAALNGLQITGGYTPVNPEPVYQYIFQVYLDPGYSIKLHTATIQGHTLSAGDSFAINGLSGVTSGDATTEPSTTTDVNFFGQQFTVYDQYWVPTTSGPVQPSGTGGVTWTFGSQDTPSDDYVNNTTSEMYIGQFSVETQDLAANQVPTGTPTVNYSFSITDVNNDPVTGNDAIQLSYIPPHTFGALAVPEPSSALIVGLTGGMGVAAGLVRRSLRRRAAGA